MSEQSRGAGAGPIASLVAPAPIGVSGMTTGSRSRGTLVTIRVVVAMPSRKPVTPIQRPPVEVMSHDVYGRNRTGVPAFTRPATVVASQLVSRTHPCDSV